MAVCEAAGGIGVTIGIGDVGLDVENGRSVHQVRTAYVHDRAEFCGMLNAQQFHAGKP